MHYFYSYLFYVCALFGGQHWAGGRIKLLEVHVGEHGRETMKHKANIMHSCRASQKLSTVTLTAAVRWCLLGKSMFCKS